MSDARSCHAVARSRGFALLITITLVAFLVLVLVALATFTRVETQVASNSRQLSQARQNALFGLGLALGQLQQYAGPDQRVTAPSDAGTSASNPERSDARPHWVGVWRDTTPNADSATPQLLTWLVSGNENIAAPRAITPLDVIPDPVGANSDTVWLVSGNTILADSDPSAPDKRVKLPKQDINAADVPGLPAGTAPRIGRYAWWIGDEGVKARVNLADPHANADGAERGFTFSMSQRAAVELVDRGQSVVKLGAAYPDSAAAGFMALDKVLALQQMSYVSDVPTVASEAARARFHDLTAHSASVLVDVAQGGLKRDLSSALAAGATVPVAADTIFPLKAGEDAYGAPTWGLLRSWASTQIAANSAGGVVTPQPLADAFLGRGSHVVAPVVTYAGIGVGYGLQNHAPAATDIPVQVHLFPVFVLWNPYTVPMAARDYTVMIAQRSTPSPTAGQRLQLRRPGGPMLHTWGLPFIGTGGLRFKLACPIIPPGQSLVFMLPLTTAVDASYEAGETELVSALNPGASVVLPTSVTAANDAEIFESVSPPVGVSIDVILAEYDATRSWPTGTLAVTTLPPTGSAALRWYQAIQQTARSLDMSIANEIMSAGPLETWSTATPAMSIDILAGFSTTGMATQWVAHANPRGPVVTRTKIDAANGYNPAWSFRKKSSITRWPDFNAVTARASSGRAHDDSGTPEDATLFEFTAPELGLLSLGQLQQAPLSPVGSHPSYAVGNSLADHSIQRTDTASAGGNAGGANVTSLMETHYDVSWRLNRALWDRYFFSTVPSAQAPTSTRLPAGVARPAWTQAEVDSGATLPNSRLRLHQSAAGIPDVGRLVSGGGGAGGDPHRQAAAHLLVAGGFNVNSTSTQAWRAVLGGSFGLRYQPEEQAEGAASDTRGAVFPRFAVPLGDSSLLASSSRWRGYRELDEDQIRQLADNIVAEVKARGPFMSLADFVNRRLVNDATGLKGALQAAIDATTSGAGAANANNLAPFNADRVTTLPAGYIAEHMRNDESSTVNAAHRSRSAYAPKFLTQADVLTALGPVLAARSDTFVIRAYGEVVNPVLAETAADYVQSRAWCEAVVQRTPDYVEPGLDAWETPAPGSANEIFGRSFKIISFRWLAPNDI